LTSEQFRLVEALFFEASGLPAEQRETFLLSSCDDGEVREEVRGMLAHASRSTDRIGDTILDDHIASLIAAPASPKASESLLRQLIGTRVGAYEFTDILGRGGMGVVYVARDTRLGRTVAIKALPPGLSRQPTRLSRFVREAKILASLSHPNVATVFGLEEATGMKFLVMERVEGETLAKRLDRGPLPLEEALEVACEIASGVEAAHAAGVIHRDLKPGNVMFKPDGKVKVLDFGLAREIGAAIVQSAPSGSGSGAGGELTLEGSVVGTPGYMSPEQLRGKGVDRRTDVFAIGCILYECLTGKVAFPGETGADVIAGILGRDPDWGLLPPETPAPVRRLLRRCVAKDADDRMRDVGDVRLELQEALEQKEWLNPPAAAQPRRTSRLAWAVPAALSVALLAATAFALLRKPASPAAAAAEQPLRRLSLQFPGAATQSNLAQVRLALSRDGGRVVVAATDGQGQHLWVRDRADADFRKLDDTANATAPALSPDGEWVAYFADGDLWKRRLAGGNPLKLADALGDWGGCRWDADHQLTYAVARCAPLARVNEEGGPPALLPVPLFTAPDSKERNATAGCLLPDGSAALFSLRGAEPEPRVEALHFASGKRHTVVERGSTPRLARTPAGLFLLWERANTVYAAPFDPKSLRVTGREVAIADGVLVNRAAMHACYDVSDDGTLAYVPGPAFAEQSRLAWVDTTDFDGAATPLTDEPMAFTEPHFSADGRRISVLVKGDRYRPYVYDASRRAMDAVTGTGDCTSVAISPDGRKLAYVSNRGGPAKVRLKDLADGGDVELIEIKGWAGDLHWSPDGRAIAYSYMPAGSTRRDVWTLDLPSNTAKPFGGASETDRHSPRFSPNGNWLAYVSNELGTPEVYIGSFPPSGKPPRQVSTGSGTRPEWTSDGRKLYYRSKGALYLAPIATNWTDGSRPAVVSRRRFGQSDADLSDYAVAPDGRLLVVEPLERATAATHIAVVLNWPKLLDAATPTAAAQR
jgi:serine/threonine protein kinase/Tol biopolymer transport system component